MEDCESLQYYFCILFIPKHVFDSILSDSILSDYKLNSLCL